MEIGLRELLFVVGIMVIAAIIFDGLRRMRKSRREEIGIETPFQPSVDRNDEIYSDELPHGGGRKVSLDGQRDDQFAGDPILDSNAMAPANHRIDAFAQSEPSNDAYRDAFAHQTGHQTSRAADSQSSQQTQEDVHSASLRLAADENGEEATEPMMAVLGQDPLASPASPASPMLPTSGDDRADREIVDDAERAAATVGQLSTSASVADGLEPSIAPPPVQEVIVINIMAKTGEKFDGKSLWRAAESSGLKYGDMKIFHRFEHNKRGKSAHLFSMANVVEPGFFDREAVAEFSTPGVCLFLSLPGPKKSVLAFELLIDTARKLAKKLNAELRDEHHSVITGQTIEHYRQRVTEFERRSLSHRPVPTS